MNSARPGSELKLQDHIEDSREVEVLPPFVRRVCEQDLILIICLFPFFTYKERLGRESGFDCRGIGRENPPYMRLLYRLRIAIAIAGNRRGRFAIFADSGGRVFVCHLVTK